jgi:hypothetical protein
MFQRNSALDGLTSFSPWRVSVTLFSLRCRYIHYAAGWMILFPFGACFLVATETSSPDLWYKASYSLGTGACRWYVGHGMKLTTHLHLVPTLTVSGALPPPSVCLSGVLRDNSTFAHSQHLVNEIICEYNPIQLQHLFQIHFNIIQADPRIRGFSIRGSPRPEKKNLKIKEINGS